MKTPIDQLNSGSNEGATDNRLVDAPQSERARPDLDAERAYPNGAPTYTSATAVPGERPLAGTADPSVAAGFSDAGVRHVQSLIETNLASSLGWEKAASAIDEASLKARFVDIARQRKGFADELQELVQRAHASPTEAVTIGSAIRRWWNNLGSSTGEARTREVLEEAERDEDGVLHAYQAALEEDSLHGIARVIGDQSVHVRRVHDEIKMLRDQPRTR